MENVKKYVAELIGTFVLVFAACGTAAAVGCNGAIADGAYVATAVSFGLVIVAMAYSIGNISGCHINPAVSLAVLINGGMTITDFIGYVVAQFAGGILGALALVPFLPEGSAFGANAVIAGDNGIVKSILIEVILTFIFVLSILGVTSKKSFSNIAGLVIGGALTLVHLLGIHFTGTSVNPARSLASAVFAGGDAIKDVWVFIVAPLIGGAVAALVWKFIGTKEDAE